MKYYIFLAVIGLVSCSPKTENLETPSFQEIASPAGLNSAEPYLFNTAKGEIYLSWIEQSDSINALHYAQLIDDQWTAPMLVASGSDWFVNWADYPQLAKNNNNFIAHYLAKSGEGTYAYDILTTQSSDGINWTEGKLLNEDSLQAEHGFVSILPYQENFLLAWLDGRNTVGNDHEDSHGNSSSGAMTLRAAIIDVNGTKLEEWELDNRICDCCQTGGIITDNGPVIVYRDRSENEVRDMSIVRWVQGKWTKPSIIYKDNWKINGCPVNGPRIDAHGNTIAIAWFTAAEEKPKVKLSFSNDGGENFIPPIIVDSTGSIGRVDVIMKDDRTAIVSWMNGADTKIKVIDIEGEVKFKSLVTTSSESRSSGFPQMELIDRKLIFAWTNDSLKQVLTSKVKLPD